MHSDTSSFTLLLGTPEHFNNQILHGAPHKAQNKLSDFATPSDMKCAWKAETGVSSIRWYKKALALIHAARATENRHWSRTTATMSYIEIRYNIGVPSLTR